MGIKGNIVRAQFAQVDSCSRNCQRIADGHYATHILGKAARGDDPRARKPALIGRFSGGRDAPCRGGFSVTDDK